MCRFYQQTPDRLLRLPHRLFDLLARHVPRLQAEEDLRAAYVAALPWSKDDSGLRALRRIALGEGDRQAAPARARAATSSRAEILALATKVRTPHGGRVVMRRKAQPTEESPKE